jgi:putative flippase GtrA
MTTTTQQPAFDRCFADSTAAGTTHQQPVLDVVIPVYNEECVLERCVRRLRRYLDHEFPISARITIADNASTDATWSIACRLAGEVGGVAAIRLAEKGRGRALHAAWGGSEATILAYMDVDLSTDLSALHPLIAPLLSGHSDIAIGTRLTHSSRVVRGRKRELISRSYNAILHAALRTRFSDAQCGFKAIRADRAKLLLPLVQDNEWFFDTELLVLAERAGLRIHEVPVDWTDDPDSRVDIAATAVADLKGVARLFRGLSAGTIRLDAVTAHGGRSRPVGVAAQAIRFAAVGLASTLVYLVLYLLLRTGMGSFTANALALLVTAVANTAANRRLTFGITTRTDAVKHQFQGLAVFLLALLMTTVSLAVLHAVDGRPARLVEATVLVLANLVATAVRFALLRRLFLGRHADMSGSPTTLTG